MALCVTTGHLVADIRGTVEYRSVYHALFMGESRDDIVWRHAEDVETALGEFQEVVSVEDACQLGRITRMGVWLSVLPYTVDRTELGAQEWMGSLFLCYGIYPPDLPAHCDVCGKAFEICHFLD